MDEIKSKETNIVPGNRLLVTNKFERSHPTKETEKKEGKLKRNRRERRDG